MTNAAEHVPVRAAMTPDPSVVDGQTTVSSALALMREMGISSLVVERRHERDEYGIVLVTDIAREVIGSGRVPSRTQVYEVMTKPAPTLDAEMGVKYAIRLMQRLGLTHALVLDARRLVGIVTLRDLVVHHIDGPARAGNHPAAVSAAVSGETKSLATTARTRA